MYDHTFETSSGKTRLMEVLKEQAFIRHRRMSDHSLDYLSLMSIYGGCSLFLHNLNSIIEYKYMVKAYVGKHCLLLY